jgi:hypothetical protein
MASRLAVAAVVLLVVVAGADALRGRGGSDGPAPAQAPVSVVPAPGAAIDPAGVPIGNDLKPGVCQPAVDERGGWTSSVCIREVRPAP